MLRWLGGTIDVETAPARVVEDQVEQLLEQLIADGRAIAPAVSLDRQLGAAAAVFQINVDGYPAAIDLPRACRVLERHGVCFPTVGL